MKVNFFMFTANMDLLPLSLFSALLTTSSLLLIFLFLWRKQGKSKLPLPPGPTAFPIVGNLFQLGKIPHESLHALSLRYGPLMTIHLGMKPVVVVSSPAMAKQIFKTHDNVFAGRHVLEVVKALSHHNFSLVWGEYGPSWRRLRRITTAELFSPKRLDLLEHLRRDQFFRTTRLLFEEKGKVVELGQMVFCMSLNLLGNMIFSTSVFDLKDPDSAELKDTIWNLMKLFAKPNSADFFPFLRFLDPQGLSLQMGKYFKVLYDISDTFIQKRLAARSQSVERKDSEKDFLDVLLDFRSEDFTLVGIRALISELFVAGTETVTTTIEWGMAEILRNPQKLNRVRDELEEVVGKSRQVEECDVDHLPYLHATVKEIFRLRPAVPLLLPHKAENSCEIGGFLIPKDSKVIVNAWGIGRDPSIWENPLEFMPERFLDEEKSKIEYSGQHFELIPFGSGRRICPAVPLGSRMVHFLLASLLHSFDWKLPDGKILEQMDMADITDEFGITFKEFNLIPVPRLPFHIY